MYKRFIKRIIDFTVSLFGLLVFSPILLIITTVLYFTQKGNVFFIQIRPGIGGKPFKIYKYKTMTDDKDDHGNLLPDEQRITPIGKIVRKYSLDELLQLINVFKGDMSLIGPRPLLMEYVPLYSKEQFKRMNVRQGIAGLAQIKGRNAISWERRFKYDVFYVNHISFGLDVWILFQAIKNVLIPSGIDFTVPSQLSKFQGSKKRVISAESYNLNLKNRNINNFKFDLDKAS